MRPVGYVYVLINPSMTGLVKVGMSERYDVGLRVAELSAATGVPEPFQLAYLAQVFDAYMVEQTAHANLRDSFDKKKEFFSCDVDDAVRAIRSVAGVDLIDEEYGDGFGLNRSSNSFGVSETNRLRCLNCGESYTSNLSACSKCGSRSRVLR